MAGTAIETAVIRGRSLRLRPLTEEDAPLAHGWFGDPEVRHWTHLSEDPPQMLTLEAHRERYRRMRDDPTQRSWCIETADGQPIGEIGLLGIRPAHGRAELAISIGDKVRWSRGLGSEAVRVTLGHAFGALHLRRVYLIVDEDNARAIRCYEKCGFAREGLLLAHRLRQGRPLNMVVMGILREEWEARAWR